MSQDDPKDPPEGVDDSWEAPPAEAAAPEPPEPPEPPAEATSTLPPPAEATSTPPPPAEATSTLPPPADQLERFIPDPELPTADLDEIVGVDKQQQAAAQNKFKLEGRAKLYAILGAGFSVFLGVVIFLSWLNSRDYYLTCGAVEVVAQRGSKFPWGKTDVGGDEFAAINITPGSECESKTFKTLAELREAFAAVLLQEASARLTTGVSEDIDQAEAQLQQALLLARSVPSKRGAIESLQGDVEYWRAANEVTTAIEQLDGAAGRFKAASDKKPRHKTDASQWAGYTSGVAQDLRRGPPELRHDIDVGPDAPPHFAGTDTAPAPVRVDEPRVPTQTDDGDKPPMGVALPPMSDTGPVVPGTPDAGLPTGGVLL